MFSRYYIKNVMSSDQLIPEDSISELVKESQVHLLQLHAMETATQLMVEDFTIFRQIGKSDFQAVFCLRMADARYGPILVSVNSLNWLESAGIEQTVNLLAIKMELASRGSYTDVQILFKWQTLPLMNLIVTLVTSNVKFKTFSFIVS